MAGRAAGVRVVLGELDVEKDTVKIDIEKPTPNP